MEERLPSRERIKMLVIDAGNSKVKVAVFNENKITSKVSFDTVDFLEQKVLRRELTKNLNEDIIAFSSVVPSIGDGIILFAENLKKDWFDVSRAQKKIVTLNYRAEQLGGDRLANIVAAFRKYVLPLIVCDFGTATTYNVLLEDGTFDGGIIAPGIETCIDSLTSKTALLSHVSIRHPPKTFLGHDTEEALVSGFYYTFSGQFKEIVGKVGERFKEGFKIIGTGGLVEFAAHVFPEIIVDKDLTLYGIKILYEENKSEETGNAKKQ